MNETAIGLSVHLVHYFCSFISTKLYGIFFRAFFVEDCVRTYIRVEKTKMKKIHLLIFVQNIMVPVPALGTRMLRSGQIGCQHSQRNKSETLTTAKQNERKKKTII